MAGEGRSWLLFLFSWLNQSCQCLVLFLHVDKAKGMAGEGRSWLLFLFSWL